jgi:hypothetical protein
MAELALHIGDGLALLQHETGVRVAEAVRGEVRRQVRLPEHAGKRLAHIGRVQRGASLGAEDPGRHRGPAASQGLRFARHQEAGERLRQHPRAIHRAAVPGFRRVGLAIRDGARHPDRAPDQIAIGPGERQGLAEPHPRARQRGEERCIARGHVGGGLQEGPPLLPRHGLDRLLPRRLGHHEAEGAAEFFRRVREEQAVIDGGLEEGAERRMDVADCVAGQGLGQFLREEGFDVPAMERAHAEGSEGRGEVPPPELLIPPDGRALEGRRDQREPPRGVGGQGQIGIDRWVAPLPAERAFSVEKVLGGASGLEGLPPTHARAVAPIRDPLAPPFADTGHRQVLPGRLGGRRRRGARRASNRTNRATGSLMVISSRSMRATLFQWRPRRSAIAFCVRPRRRRCCLSSLPRIGMP